MTVYPKMTFLLMILFPVITFSQTRENYPPEGFVYVHEIIPEVQYEIRYAGDHNFIGQSIPGYEKPVAILTLEAAQALKQVESALNARGYLLKVFDGYRPQRAVDYFVEWAKDPTATEMKSEFYPNVAKTDLFKLNYIASKSGHSRGSTVDLTLVDKATGEELDMGSYYDFFGEISHHNSENISAQQKSNRKILKNAMQEQGFKALPEEWWHYSLENEPYPETYFNFPVK